MTSRKTSALLCAAWLLSVSGCSRVVEPTSTESQTLGSSAAADAGFAGMGTGFVLQPAAVALPLTNVGVVTDASTGATRWRGSEGAISLFLNGATMASLDGDATPNQAFPFTGTADEHNQRVRDYFVGLGLPSDQILSVHVNAQMGSSGRIDESPVPYFISYATVLTRGIQGVLVPDSVAWGRLNDARQFVAMTVFWPTIADSVVADALALQAKMADSAQRATFLSKLPAGLPDGRVVIRHASVGTTQLTDNSAKATYEVTVDAGGMSYFRHFDKDGVEFRLPEERASAKTAAR